MDNSNRTSNANFENTWKNLEQFGEKGHEHLVTVKNEDGSYSFKTEAKGNESLLGRIISFLGLRYKPEEKRLATVARTLCEFLEKNETFLSSSLSPGKIPSNFLHKFDPLFNDNKTTAFAAKFHGLEARQSSREANLQARETDRQMGNAVFICHDGKEVRFKLPATMSISNFVSSNQIQGAVSNSESANEVSAESKKIEHKIQLTEQYSGETVELLVDLIYGTKNFEQINNLNQLLPILNLSQQLGLKDIEDKCKQASVKLFTENPKNIIAESFTAAFFIPHKAELLDFLVRQLSTLDPQTIKHTFASIDAEKKDVFFQLMIENPSSTPEHSIMLGFLHEHGIGTEINTREAFKCYESAANKGYSVAQYHLGRCYQEDIGTDKNIGRNESFKEAFKNYESAAEKGYAPALDALGNCYLRGIGVTEDKNQAKELFESAAKQNLPSAYYNLGIYYQHYDKNNFLQNVDRKALENYSKAALLNYTPALRDLINLHKDPKRWYGKEKLLECVQRSASLGIPLAQYELGNCYWNGVDLKDIQIKKDHDMAIHYYKLAADQGLHEAQIKLPKAMKQK